MKKLLLLIAAILLAGAFGYWLQSFYVEWLQREAQQILDRIGDNALAVDAVNAPRLAFIPFVGPSEWRSYIFLTGKNGRALDPKNCPLTADYEVKLSDTNTLREFKSVIRVHVEGLQECSRALQANR